LNIAAIPDGYEVPYEMKAVSLQPDAPSPRLVLGDHPKPSPGPGEVLLQVAAAAVTPSELLWYPTSHTADGQPRTGAIPGHEFAGTVAGIGPGVTGLTLGEQVYGINDWFAQGATAEFCLAAAATLAPPPRRLSLVEAATVPISALTAWQGLFDRAGLQAGERVLVHGGSGAVGMFVIQLAKLHGAEVVATASAANLDFLHTLKADRAIDYRLHDFERTLPKVDVVFDTVGGDTLERSWSLLRPGGRLVTIAADSEGARDERTKSAFFIVEPRQQELRDIALLIDGGSLHTFVGAVVPLASAPEAYQGITPRPSGRGKVVVEIQGLTE
jgi:NADPH:quinone reductase-like Zn-dependent oxidoreductase